MPGPWILFYRYKLGWVLRLEGLFLVVSLRIIEFLTYNAVIEKRFQDAAQYYWMLSAESLRLVKETDEKATKEDRKFL